MSDDIEQRLRQVTPRTATPELRSRILAAVADELSAAPVRRWRFRLGPAVAACLVAGVALNYWLTASLQHQLTLLLGPPPVSREAAEIAAEIASVTDAPTAKWAYDQLASARVRRADPFQYTVRLRRMIQQWNVEPKETADATIPQGRQMDRDLHGRHGRPPLGLQCLVRLEHGSRAWASTA